MDTSAITNRIQNAGFLTATYPILCPKSGDLGKMRLSPEPRAVFQNKWA